MNQESWGKLARNLNRMGIEVVGFDMDDTLTRSRQDFVRAINGAAIALIGIESWEETEGNEQLRQKITEAKSKINEVLWGLRPEFCVDPQIMEVAVAVAAKWLGVEDEEKIDRARDLAKRAYINENPVAYPGTEEMVEAFNNCLPPWGRTLVVSHSRRERMVERCRLAGLAGKFSGYHDMDVRRPKSEQWDEFYGKNKVDPRTFLMVGDNLLADIKPVVMRGGVGVHVLNLNGEVFGTDKDTGVVLPEGRFFCAKTTADVVKVLADEVSLNK